MSLKTTLLTLNALALITVGILVYLLQSNPQPVFKVKKGDIEVIVRDYLLRNPHVVEEAMIAQRNKQVALQEKQQLGAIRANKDQIFTASHDYVAGNPNGDITIVEFSDYNCGFCRRAFKDIQTVLKKDKNIRVVFKELPIFGDHSVAAAKAALAAVHQDKYFEFRRHMLTDEGRANNAKALKIAEKLGMDVEKLKTDMDDPKISAALEANSLLADKIGVQGTPFYIVGDHIINGAPEDLADQFLEKIEEIREVRKNKT